jgi:hypothetical protein
MASSFLLVPAAGTTGEVTALFETNHQFAGKLFLGLRNRQRNEARFGRVSALLVKIGGAAGNQKTSLFSMLYRMTNLWRAGHLGRYSDVNTNRARLVSINTSILGR